MEKHALLGYNYKQWGDTFMGVEELNDNVLSPQDVRKILETDNLEIIKLCKKADVSPKKTNDGKTYFSMDDVRALKQVKDASLKTPTISKNASQLVVDSLMKSLQRMENNITSAVTDILDTRLEGMDEVVVELIRCKTENENLKNQIEELNKENYNLRKENASYKPFMLGLYYKDQVEKSLF